MCIINIYITLITQHFFFRRKKFLRKKQKIIIHVETYEKHTIEKSGAPEPKDGRNDKGVDKIDKSKEVRDKRKEESTEKRKDSRTLK